MTDGEVNLQLATVDDVPALLALMDSVLEWLVERGRPQQWGTVPFSRVPGFPERVNDWVSKGVVTLAERDNKCVGALAAAAVVPPRIPNGLVPDGSVFVYMVLSDRGPAGRGVGPALLDEAERLARAQDAPALALDHWVGSPELDRVYGGAGYVAVGEAIDESGGESLRTVVRVRPLTTSE